MSSWCRQITCSPSMSHLIQTHRKTHGTPLTRTCTTSWHWIAISARMQTALPPCSTTCRVYLLFLRLELSVTIPLLSISTLMRRARSKCFSSQRIEFGSTYRTRWRSLNTPQLIESSRPQTSLTSIHHSGSIEAIFSRATTSRRCWSDLPFTTRKVKSSINRSTWRFEPRKDPLMDVSTSRPMWRWPNFSMLTTNSQRKEAVNPSKACSGELRDAMGQRVE